jgi:predicted nucleotidyltransferase
MKISSKIKNQILEIIFRRLNPDETSVFLFGSQVDKFAPSRSDIDIGIISNQQIDDYVILTLSDELNFMVDTLIKIDLVDFNAVDQKFKEIALRTVEKWHIAKNSKEILKI